MKVLKRILIVIAAIVGVFITILATATLFGYYQYNTARDKAYREISTLVPVSKQLKMKVTPTTSGIVLFSPSYNVDVTTKEDYERWKKEVLKRGKLFSHTEPSSSLEDYVKDVNNCEFFYSSLQTVKKGKPAHNILMVFDGEDGYNLYPNPKSPYTNQRHFKSWNEALKRMYDTFSYVPSNEDLVKKWKFPKQNVEEMSSYRKKLVR